MFFNTKKNFSTPKSTPNFGVTPKFSKKNTRNDHQKKNPENLDGSRFLLGLKSATVSNVLILTAVHFRNQIRRKTLNSPKTSNS